MHTKWALYLCENLIWSSSFPVLVSFEPKVPQRKGFLPLLWMFCSGNSDTEREFLYVNPSNMKQQISLSFVSWTTRAKNIRHFTCVNSSTMFIQIAFLAKWFRTKVTTGGVLSSMRSHVSSQICFLLKFRCWQEWQLISVNQGYVVLMTTSPRLNVIWMYTYTLRISLGWG